MLQSIDAIAGKRLASDETFCFACRPELSCFNSCCRNKRLSLFPYDVLRLRQALGLPSWELLDRHVELELDPNSGWPLLRIRLLEDGRCPFVGPAGCTVYAHRPTCCRIYPLARAVTMDSDGSAEEIYIAEETPLCLGWRESHQLKVADWIQEQGLTDYQAANIRLMHLLQHPQRPQPFSLAPQQLHAAILALYNLDRLRQALSDPARAGRFSFSPERVQHALENDLALLELGQDWLTSQLFGP